MKKLLIVLLTIFTTTANAEVFKCTSIHEGHGYNQYSGIKYLGKKLTLDDVVYQDKLYPVTDIYTKIIDIDREVYKETKETISESPWKYSKAEYTEHTTKTINLMNEGNKITFSIMDKRGSYKKVAIYMDLTKKNSIWYRKDTDATLFLEQITYSYLDNSTVWSHMGCKIID